MNRLSMVHGMPRLSSVHFSAKVGEKASGVVEMADIFIILSGKTHVLNNEQIKELVKLSELRQKGRLEEHREGLMEFWEDFKSNVIHEKQGRGDITTRINMDGRARKKGVKIVSDIELNTLKFETRITWNHHHLEVKTWHGELRDDVPKMWRKAGGAVLCQRESGKNNRHDSSRYHDEGAVHTLDRMRARAPHTRG